ncbi:MAG: DUF4388 domain-containing protein [Acidimicrobiia bacterium]
MSLTGHIDVFPLEEVLRLLARSYKSGCLRVDASDLHGRIFLSGGSLTFATVGTDEDMRRQLLASKVTSDEAVRAAEVGGRSLTDTPTETSSVGDFFREEVVESLYRIRKPGKGQFVFNVDLAPKYRSESTFDVELCIAEADRRAAEWSDIESVITGIEQPLRVVSEAPHNEPVTLAPNTWKLVANFEGVSSIRAMSDRLGNSRFRVAKDLAALVRGGLVETVSTEQPTRYEMPRATGAPAEVVHEAETVEESVDHQPGAEVATEAEAETPPDYNRSWWSEAVEAADEPAADEPVVEVEAPLTEDEPEEPQEGDASGESFLDKVFAQLNDNPEGQGVSSPVATQGFLKRRRMSSVGLDE